MSSEIVITHQQFQQLISTLDDIRKSLDGIKKELQQTRRYKT